MQNPFACDESCLALLRETFGSAEVYLLFLFALIFLYVAILHYTSSYFERKADRKRAKEKEKLDYLADAYGAYTCRECSAEFDALSQKQQCPKCGSIYVYSINSSELSSGPIKSIPAIPRYNAFKYALTFVGIIGILFLGFPLFFLL